MNEDKWYATMQLRWFNGTLQQKYGNDTGTAVKWVDVPVFKECKLKQKVK